MRINFDTLAIQGFRTIENAIIPIGRLGLVSVEGEVLGSDQFDSNGAGKSSISSEALVWCLYGKVPDRSAGSDQLTDLGR